MRPAQRRRTDNDQLVIGQAMWGEPFETLDEMRRQAPERNGLKWGARILLVLLALMVFAMSGSGWIMYVVMAP